VIRINALISFSLAGILFPAIMVCLLASAARSQELVLTPAFDTSGTPMPKPAVIFSDVSAGLPNPPKTYVAPLDAPPLSAHGLALIAADRALMTQVESSAGQPGGVTLVDTATATRIETYALPATATIPPTPYDGFGTLAINPSRTHILASPDSTHFG
jgi:hypothetical protein